MQPVKINYEMILKGIEVIKRLDRYFAEKKEAEEVEKEERLQYLDIAREDHDVLCSCSLCEEYQELNEEFQKSVCEACRGHKYWCRGCDSTRRLEVLTKLGVSEEFFHDVIRKKYFGCCSLEMAPCYVCNYNEGTFWQDAPNLIKK